LGRSAALRIYYTGPRLTDPQTKNLVDIQLSHEDLLYRVANSGESGRSLMHKKKFATPLSRVASVRGGNRAWHTLNNHRLGMNTSGGRIEFRYFDSSLHAPAVQASVALALGMVGAAMDGRLQGGKEHPVRFYSGLVPKFIRWNQLVTETVGKGPIATQLDKHL